MTYLPHAAGDINAPIAIEERLFVPTEQSTHNGFCDPDDTATENALLNYRRF